MQNNLVMLWQINFNIDKTKYIDNLRCKFIRMIKKIKIMIVRVLILSGWKIIYIFVLM